MIEGIERIGEDYQVNMSSLQNVRFQLRMCKFAFNHHNNPYRLGFSFNNVVRPQNKNMLLHLDDSLRQRHLQFLLFASQSQYQGARRDWAEEYLPKFVQEGPQVKVKKSEDYIEIRSGIMYRNIKDGKGGGIEEKQMFAFLKKEVSLRYSYYKQSGEFVEIKDFHGSLDSLAGSADKFGPGIKEGIIGMKQKGKRIIIIPLQGKYGVFGVELRSIHHEWNLFG